MPLLSVSTAHDGALMPDEVLTIKEVAALLKLAEKTVYAMANAGEIPAFKIRGQWRIKRAELDQWIDAQPRGGDGGATMAAHDERVITLLLQAPRSASFDSDAMNAGHTHEEKNRCR